MEWSHYQKEIFRFVEEEQGSAVIIATAGSGKSSTIIECARRIPNDQRVSFVAFNRAIADELKAKVPPHVHAQTLNGMGFSALRRHLNARYFKLESRKTSAIMDENMTKEALTLYASGLRKLIGLAKAHGIVPKGTAGTGLTMDTEQNWADLIDKYNVEFEGNAKPEKAIEFARSILEQSIEVAQEQSFIDFDDQLYLPVIWQAQFEPYDFMFVDELQDLSMIQRSMIKMSLKQGGRMIGVGDPAQCQPDGTMVKTPTGLKAIEEIKKGEKLVSVDIAHSCFKASGEVVLDVSKRRFSGELIVVESENRRSRYTPNHRCIVNFSPLQKTYAVYLMRKKDNFRIGSTKFGIGPYNGTGIRTRMLMEKADALWVLSLHSTKAEAILREALLASKYGISERTFISQTANGEKGLNQEFLDMFWAMAEKRTCQAHRLLTDFNRNIDYPLVSKETANKFSIRRPSIVRACNLIDGVLVLHDQKTIHYKKHLWTSATVRYEHFDGFVHSLLLAGKETYIADGIATHNSIYSFRGASIDAVNLIEQEFNAVELPLSISYRCPKSVVAEARKLVSHIEAADNAPDGKVETIGQFNADFFTNDDGIVCRNSAPIIDLAYKFLRSGKACRVLGREIGQGLITLIKKMDADSIDDLEEKLHRYKDREVRKLIAKGKEEKADALTDRVATIRIFIDQVPETSRTVAKLASMIESLFTDDNKGLLTLMTVHKSKGLQFPRVFILDRYLMPSKWARQAWQQQEEKNIQYVAITRTMKELYYIDRKNWIESKSRGVLK